MQIDFFSADNEVKRNFNLYLEPLKVKSNI